MDYKILNAETMKELTELVKQHLRESWQCLGAPFIECESDYTKSWCYQAMTRSVYEVTTTLA